MKVCVIGAGTMGNGIVHVFAQYGYDITVCDIDKSQLEKAQKTIEKNLERQVAKNVISAKVSKDALAKIVYSTSLEDAVVESDLIVEAATENEVIKLNIFKEMDTHAPKSAILATNTSSISITKIAGVTSRPDKVIGMHFMNPVPVMKLVEIINGYSTSDATTKKVVEIAKKLDKEPVVVNDYPGFVANRILMPMINEAVYALYEGVAGVAEIDAIMKLGMAHPMGPLQLADFIGLDVCEAILKVLYEGLGNQKYAPCPLLRNMVSAGNLGRKSGEGFYKYEKGSKELKVSTKFL
jgi:3-hydroxybutyryl-CoA dehydrogenase